MLNISQLRMEENLQFNLKSVSKFILSNILGWEIKDEFPDIKKSIVLFAPHTSYFDGLYGKLYLMHSGINYKFLSKKEFFKFPLKYFFKAFGSIPVYNNKEYIDQIVELFNTNKELHIVLSPEGHLAKTTHWKKGFYYMSARADIPIIVGYLDYKKKEIGIKGVITKIDDVNTTMTKINKMYKNVNAKYPENFATDLRFN